MIESTLVTHTQTISATDALNSASMRPLICAPVAASAQNVVVDTYTNPERSGGNVPYLPVLVGVLFAVLAATVVVVQKTSA